MVSPHKPVTKACGLSPYTGRQTKTPFFFGYKIELFPSKTIPKDLDPSYKTDLDLWDCLGKVKLVLYQNFTGLI